MISVIFIADSFLNFIKKLAPMNRESTSKG